MACIDLLQHSSHEMQDLIENFAALALLDVRWQGNNHKCILKMSMNFAHMHLAHIEFPKTKLKKIDVGGFGSSEQATN